jgi:hypothetical protein
MQENIMMLETVSFSAGMIWNVVIEEAWSIYQ